MLSRPLVGMDEEPSELEKLCASAHAEIASVHASLSGGIGAGWGSDEDWDIAAQDASLSDADTGTPRMLLDMQVAPFPPALCHAMQCCQLECLCKSSALFDSCFDRLSFKLESKRRQPGIHF